MRNVMEPARQCCRQDKGTPKAVNAIIKWLCHGYAIVDFVFMKFFSHSETFWSFPKNKTKNKKVAKVFSDMLFSLCFSACADEQSMWLYNFLWSVCPHDQIQCTLELSSKELCKGKILKKRWCSSSHCTFVVVVLAMLAQIPIRKKYFLLFKPL